jgi:hypothetical protein
MILVDISKGDQFKPEFLAISPNNRMPAIVNHGDHALLALLDGLRRANQNLVSPSQLQSRDEFPDALAAPSLLGAAQVEPVSPCIFGKCREILAKCRETPSATELKAFNPQ